MFFKGLFSKNNSTSTNSEIGGDIKRYELVDWWMNDLTEEEREIIRNTFKPMDIFSGEYFIDKGRVTETTNVKSKFMGTLATWFLQPDYYDICKKILKEAEKYIDNEINILNQHFYYASCMKVHYTCRNVEDEALYKSIYFAEKQISLSQQAKKAFLKDYPKDKLPGHSGYKQLAIIYEKQKMYDKAIELSKQALIEGWSGDWLNRIDRLKRKVSK